MVALGTPELRLEELANSTLPKLDRAWSSHFANVPTDQALDVEGRVPFAHRHMLPVQLPSRLRSLGLEWLTA